MLDVIATETTPSKTSQKFKNENGKLHRRVTAETEDGQRRSRWVPFASELHVRALTRSADSEDWGRLVEFTDLDGKNHLWALPATLFAGTGEAIRAELFRLGHRLDHSRQAKDWLMEFLVEAEPAARARSVPNIGWHDGAFVLPEETISAKPEGEWILLQNTDCPDHAFATAGSLKDWQDQVALPATGNSRLVLALSAAFAAPLLALTGEDGGGIHLRGGSSSGKSTALAVAGSVWGGGGRGFVQSWRATDNALEAMAALHNHTLLCLDELSQVDPRAAGQAAYMLGNGLGKARAGRDGQARKPHEWRLMFLSNGEMGLADKIREAGGRIAAGMEVRIIDLRADAGAGKGIFEETHGADTPARFARDLKTAAQTQYGTPSRAFLKRVVENPDTIRTRLFQLRSAFTAHIPADADGQVRRVADRFALIAAAGRLATEFGLTRWPREESEAAAHRCFQDWLTERGGTGASELTDAKARLRRAIEAEPHRFQNWHADPRTAHRQKTLGYVKHAEDAVPTHYLHVSGTEELFAGLDRKTILTALADAGILTRFTTTPKSGPPKPTLNKPFKVPAAGTTVRLFELRSTAGL